MNVGSPLQNKIEKVCDNYGFSAVQSSWSASIHVLQNAIHGLNVDAGWWDESEYLRHLTPAEQEAHAALVNSQKLALIHSEISEALEGLRKGKMDEHLPHRLNEEVELADAMIRLLDYADHRGFDMALTIAEKVDYNMRRADHKRENRSAEGGKKF